MNGLESACQWGTGCGASLVEESVWKRCRMLRRLDSVVDDRDARHCMFHSGGELTSGNAHLSLSISPISRSKVI